MTLDYFYGQSGELFSYFRIPKALFQDSRFRQLSTDARTLYGILLDRIIVPHFRKCNIKLVDLKATDLQNFYNKQLATVYKGNIIKNLIMDCQSYTKYRPNETTGGIFVSWRRKEELPTGA